MLSILIFFGFFTKCKVTNQYSLLMAHLPGCIPCKSHAEDTQMARRSGGMLPQKTLNFPSPRRISVISMKNFLKRYTKHYAEKADCTLLRQGILISTPKIFRFGYCTWNAPWLIYPIDIKIFWQVVYRVYVKGSHLLQLCHWNSGAFQATQDDCYLSRWLNPVLCIKSGSVIIKSQYHTIIFTHK